VQAGPALEDAPPRKDLDMNYAFIDRAWLRTTMLASFGTALVLGALVVGCSDPDVNIDRLTVDPSAANKGETLLVEGEVSSLAELTSVTITVHDEKDAPLPASAGITISNNALQRDRVSWDLREEGDVKIVTSASTPSGRYKLRVEGKTSQKNSIDVTTFTVR
jgi:hypothetical protein